MAGTKIDRRVRKTKALLLNGLIELMKEKDIKDISVKELSDLADINRGTFYLHYRDVFDMLAQVEQELFCKFNAILDRNFTDHGGPSPYAALKDIFLLLADYRGTARALIGPHGDLSFVNQLKDLVRLRILRIWENQEPAAKEFDYYYSFIVSGCTGAIETWLAKEQPERPEEIARIVSEMIERGIRDTFGKAMGK